MSVVVELNRPSKLLQMKCLRPNPKPKQQMSVSGVGLHPIMQVKPSDCLRLSL